MRRMVLIVADERDTNDAISELLSGDGYSCVGALEAERGLALLLQFRPDVVLLDLTFPNVNAMEFLRRKSESTRHIADIPVIVIAAVTPVPKLDNIVAVLQKPFDYEELLAIVAKLAPVEKPAA